MSLNQSSRTASMAALLGALVFGATVQQATTACTGITVREEVLMPAMLLVWEQAIAGDIEAGVASQEAAGTITPAQATEMRSASKAMAAALKTGERRQVATVNWAMLRQVALTGIQARVTAGELGPTVALSFVETINLFDQRHTQLLLR